MRTIITIILLVLTLGTAGSRAAAQQQEAVEEKSTRIEFFPNVPIPGLFEAKDAEHGIPVDETLFGRYVSAFYIYFAGVAGILAVVVMMWGGFHYITSAGNPQKMSQGKEIISNAIIGLVLVLTSYLLLNLINPRLTKLRIPSISYVPQLLLGGRYCEGSDDPAALAAAKAKNAQCGDTVEYTKPGGKKATCISLYLNRDNRFTDKGEELACFPHFVEGPNGSLVVKYENSPSDDDKTTVTVQKICEDNQYTGDSRCSNAEQIIALQDKFHTQQDGSPGWIKGACKKADFPHGHDKCLYRSFFTCPSRATQVSCNRGGFSDTACWNENGPRWVTSIERPEGNILSQSVHAHCIDPSTTNHPIEYVDAACCLNTKKERVVCSTKGIDNMEIRVDCEPYNSQPGSFARRGSDSPDPTKCTGNEKCWAALFLNYTQETETGTP